MTLTEAREWLATLPFRDVNTERTYNARGEDDPDGAPYDPDRVMTNTYLQVDEWIYWFIGPRQLARHHSSRPQHEPIRASGRRPFGGR